MVRLLYIDLEAMAADCLLEREGGGMMHFHISREDWRVDRFDGERCTGSETHQYTLERLDSDGVPVLVKWVARGLHGLPQGWKAELDF